MYDSESVNRSNDFSAHPLKLSYIKQCASGGKRRFRAVEEDPLPGGAGKTSSPHICGFIGRRKTRVAWPSCPRFFRRKIEYIVSTSVLELLSGAGSVGKVCKDPLHRALPVATRLPQRLSHTCLRITFYMAKLRVAH